MKRLMKYFCEKKSSVIKHIALVAAFLFLPVSIFAYTSPGKSTGFVNDFAHVLSVPEIQEITTKAKALKDNAGVELAVVTIPNLNNDTIENYAVKLFAEWGIGNKTKDTGLLILVAPNEHQVRIEVGYGLEGMITDLQSGNIIRSVMTPAFKQNKYADGIYGAVTALGEIISGSPDAIQYSLDNTSTQNSSGSGLGVSPLAIFFIIIFVLNGLSRFLGKTKSWWLGGVIGAGFGLVIGFVSQSLAAGIFATVFLTLFGLAFDFIVSRRPPGSGGGTGFWPMFFGGGRGGFGGSSGGFGGFGGGMSGGGGASGRW